MLTQRLRRCFDDEIGVAHADAGLAPGLDELAAQPYQLGYVEFGHQGELRHALQAGMHPLADRFAHAAIRHRFDRRRGRLAGGRRCRLAGWRRLARAPRRDLAFDILLLDAAPRAAATNRCQIDAVFGRELPRQRRRCHVAWLRSRGSDYSRGGLRLGETRGVPTDILLVDAPTGSTAWHL